MAATLALLLELHVPAGSIGRVLPRVLDSVELGSLLRLYWVSFAFVVGLFCVCRGSLLCMWWVSFGSVSGLFCVCLRSLLRLPLVSFASVLGLFCACFEFL